MGFTLSTGSPSQFKLHRRLIRFMEDVWTKTDGQNIRQHFKTVFFHQFHDRLLCNLTKCSYGLTCIVRTVIVIYVRTVVLYTIRTVLMLVDRKLTVWANVDVQENVKSTFGSKVRGEKRAFRLDSWDRAVLQNSRRSKYIDGYR